MWTPSCGGGVLLCLPQQEGNVFLSQINVGGQGQNGGSAVRKGSGSLSLVSLPSLARGFHLRVQEGSSTAANTPTRQPAGGEGERKDLPLS